LILIRDIHVVALCCARDMFTTCNAGCFVELFNIYLVSNNNSFPGNYCSYQNIPQLTVCSITLRSFTWGV